MRHRVYGKHLGRNKDERDNLFRGLVRSLFTHGTIQTSEAKAKAIKGLVDKIINAARKNPEAAPGNRTSGHSSIVRLGTRPGDQTMMVRMSLIGAERLSVTSSQLSDTGKSVVGKTVTDKQTTEKPKSENRKQKTDNRKIKKLSSRSKK